MGRTPLSDSRIRAAACLLHFKALYIDKVPFSKPIYMLTGGWFHHIAELYLTGLRENRARGAAAESRVAFVREVFDREWAVRGGDEFATLPDSERDEMADLCRRWAERVDISDNFIGAEVRVAMTEKWEVTPWMEPGVFYRGIMDRVDVDPSGIVDITDHKTSWKVASQEEVERSPQLRGYAAQVKAVLPEATGIRVHLDFVRHGVVRSVTLSTDVIEDARARILDESNRIEAAKKKDRWPATPGALCATCPVFRQCPLRDEAAQFVPPATMPEREALLAQYIMQERAMKEVAERLKAAVAEEGPIRIGGMIAHFRLEERRSWPSGPLAEALKWHGVEPLDVLRADAKALDKVCRRDESLRASVDGMTEVSRYSKWAVQRDDGEE